MPNLFHLSCWSSRLLFLLSFIPSLRRSALILLPPFRGRRQVRVQALRLPLPRCHQQQWTFSVLRSNDHGGTRTTRQKKILGSLVKAFWNRGGRRGRVHLRGLGERTITTATGTAMKPYDQAKRTSKSPRQESAAQSDEEEDDGSASSDSSSSSSSASPQRSASKSKSDNSNNSDSEATVVTTSSVQTMRPRDWDV
jgi:hypothetical protein